MDERNFGRLEGKLDAIHGDVKDLKRDVKGLHAFRWWTTGGLAVIVCILEWITHS